jgi:hypothetical protein
MYVKNYGKTEQINFLASAKFQAFTYQISDAGVVADVNGKKLVPAGTVYPLNDATAVGITLTETDVTFGPQPGSVMVEGYVIEARLPVAPVAAAKTALKEIKFR